MPPRPLTRLWLFCLFPLLDSVVLTSFGSTLGMLKDYNAPQGALMFSSDNGFSPGIFFGEFVDRVLSPMLVYIFVIELALAAVVEFLASLRGARLFPAALPFLNSLALTVIVVRVGYVHGSKMSLAQSVLLVFLPILLIEGLVRLSATAFRRQRGKP